MPTINLVHDRQVAIRKSEQKARGLFFTSVGIFVGSVLLYGSLSLKADGLGRDQAQANLKLSQLKPLVAKTEFNEKLTNELLPRVDTLENAQKTSDRWSRILAHFTQNTPSGVWLTALKANCDDVKKPISLTLTGKGVDQKTIADLILRASSLQDLENVNLKYSELRQESENHAIDFEVGADVSGTEPVVPKPAGSGS